ncbi:MAG: hypothetical protein DI626_01600 [Micavibrio aeruginosavorus]|uniref:Uncharacterized protein n=1 Tax=Micavibrio aeruginosavorus TaxID=349221 RepID=A0A2W5A1Z3_9BACT|nr:MAG: hypothetical protein DI626_01600 [Micavibrio aeruginosavorus]
MSKFTEICSKIGDAFVRATEKGYISRPYAGYLPLSLANGKPPEQDGMMEVNGDMSAFGRVSPETAPKKPERVVSPDVLRPYGM